MSWFKQAIHAGININDASIELIVVDDVEHPKKITYSGRVILSPGTIVHGVIADEQKFLRAIRSIKGVAKLPFVAMHATLSLSEEIIFPFTLKDAPQGPSAEEVIRHELSSRIPIPEEDMWIMQLAHDVHAPLFGYAVRKSVVEKFRRLLKQEKITLATIEPESVALSRMVLPDVVRQKNATIIDIGTNITHVLTLTEGKPVLSQTIPFGAEQIKHDLNASTLVTLRAGIMTDIQKRILEADEFLKKHFFNSQDNMLLLVAGGGSLIPHIIDALQKGVGKHIQIAEIGNVIDFGPCKKEDRPLFFHAIGSALRERASTTGTILKTQNLFEKKPRSFSFLSLSAFKQRVRLVMVAAIVLFAVLVGAMVIFLSNKQVEKSAKTQTKNSSTNQNVGSSLLLYSIETPVAADALAQQILEEQLTKETIVESTGKKQAPANAHGEVQLINTTNEDKVLAANTRLEASDGIIFRIPESITIPKNGKISVTVTADQEGKQGEIQPQRLKIPGLSEQNQQLIYAENSVAFTGGTKDVKVVVATDLELAESLMKESINFTLNQKLAARTPSGTEIIFVASATQFIVSKDPQAETVADSAKITIHAKGFGIVVNSNALLELSQEKITSGATITDTKVTARSLDLEGKKCVLQIAVSSKR